MRNADNARPKKNDQKEQYTKGSSFRIFASIWGLQRKGSRIAMLPSSNLLLQRNLHAIDAAAESKGAAFIIDQ